MQGPGAKIQVDELDRLLSQPRDLRFAKHAALSLTQSTELGTVYAPEEVGALSKRAKASGLAVHMDGARFANAVAALNCTPAQITHKAGVDVLCFGCTKNGISCGEAVVFFNREMALDFDYRCKQAGQVASKMRFITSQWVGLLENGVWLKNAAHANAMAQRLESVLKKTTKVEVLHPVQANAVFAAIPADTLQRMHDRGWELYCLAGSGGARLMCSWDTLPEDVDQFVRELQAAYAA